MRKSKFDRAITRAVMKQLDSAVRKHGRVDVRHAVNKWATGQRERESLIKQRRLLARQLAEANRRLRS